MACFHVIAEKRIGMKLQSFYLVINEAGNVSTSITEPSPMSKNDADSVYHHARIFMPEFGLKIQAAN